LNILCVNYSLYSPYGDDVIIQDGVSRNRPIPYTSVYYVLRLCIDVNVQGPKGSGCVSAEVRS